MHGVISWRSSCVLAQELPKHSAMLPVAEAPLPPPQPTGTRCLDRIIVQVGSSRLPGSWGARGRGGQWR